jgi:hypothetical protein
MRDRSPLPTNSREILIVRGILLVQPGEIRYIYLLVYIAQRHRPYLDRTKLHHFRTDENFQIHLLPWLA